jgi:hypothetical protein
VALRRAPPPRCRGGANSACGCATEEVSNEELFGIADLEDSSDTAEKRCEEICGEFLYIITLPGRD